MTNRMMHITELMAMSNKDNVLNTGIMQLVLNTSGNFQREHD